MKKGITWNPNDICHHFGPMWFLSDAAVAVAIDRIEGGSEGEGGRRRRHG